MAAMLAIHRQPNVIAKQVTAIQESTPYDVSTLKGTCVMVPVLVLIIKLEEHWLAFVSLLQIATS